MKLINLVFISITLLITISSTNASASDSTYCLTRTKLKEESAIASKSDDVLALRRVLKHYQFCEGKTDKKVEDLQSRLAKLGTQIDKAVWADVLENKGLLDQAFPYYLQAAEEGELSSQVAVGKMLLNGEGTKKDLAKGKFWLTMAAFRKSFDATYALHEYFEKTDDKVASAIWLERSSRIAPPGLKSKTEEKLKRIKESLNERQVSLMSELDEEPF